MNVAILKQILLVEDNPSDIELTLIALERSQLANKVHVVRDGEEALEYLFCEGRYSDRPPVNPAIVLLDIKLPKIDGHEVLRRIRASTQLKTTPVAMLTSSKGEKDVLNSYLEGVNAYVIKPDDINSLVDAVRQLGTFWLTINEPPPRSLRAPES